MPMHDWTRVNSGLFHHFHVGWCCEIGRALNRGKLPDSYSALMERHSGISVTQSDPSYYADKASRLAIHHRLGRVVAFIEIVSPGNKHDEVSIENFCDKIAEAIRARIHVLVIDLFPPTRRDPFGIHKRIWDSFEPDELFALTDSQNRTMASYEADGVNTAFIETLGVGETLPKMPLFIAPGSHVLVPLEETYSLAWTDTPKSVRRLVE